MGDAVIARDYDLLGRQITNSDADGGVTRYEFDRFGRTVRVSDNSGWSTFAYDRGIEPRGLLTSFTDSVAGTFTTRYSADEQLVELTYPGGLTRRDTLDANLEPVGRTYTRDSDGMVIYAESAVENSHGQRMSHTYTGGSRTYGYDRSGRLTKVEQAAAGGCVSRSYGYDDRTNRTWKAVFNPAADGSCRSDVADATEQHSYDSADRITDAGFSYDPFGRTVAVPGGLTNTYYTNDLVATQLLDTTRRTWTTYPDQRLRRATTETLAGGVWTMSATTVNHYGNDTDRPRWVSEDGGLVSRYLSGPDDALIASTSATGDVRLRLTNLHGDVSVTIDTALTAPEFVDFDEYGVPAPGQAPQRYGWLGGKQRSAEALGGAVLMGVRLYSPTLGRFLQVDPVPGGGATAYDYCFGDAVNCTDLDGRWPSWLKPKSVWNGVKKAASWTYAHSSDIGTVVGCVSMFLPPPANLIGGAIALTFSIVGGVREARAGNWGQLGLTALGAVPGVGAAAKGLKYLGTVRQLGAATKKLGEYVPKYGSKAQKLKDLVRPWRKAGTAKTRQRPPWRRGSAPPTGSRTSTLAEWRASTGHHARTGHPTAGTTYRDGRR